MLNQNPLIERTYNTMAREKGQKVMPVLCKALYKASVIKPYQKIFSYRLALVA